MRAALLMAVALLAGCSCFRVAFELDLPAFGKAKWQSEGEGPAVSVTVTNR